MDLGILSVLEIAPAVGDRMLNYHLQRGVLVGLIEPDREKMIGPGGAGETHVQRFLVIICFFLNLCYE